MSAASFAICPTSILADVNLTRLDVSVFTALKSHARPGKPLVWPSRTRLARLVGCALASVSRSLKRLVAAGWILVTRTGRANRITVFDAPQDHIRCDARVTSTPLYGKREINTPLPPASGGSEIAVTEIPESIPAPQLSATVPEEPTPDVATAQAIVEHLNATTHSHLPTDPNASIVRRVTRRLKTFAPQDIKAAITHGANVFRIPSAMLKPSILESLISQVKADAERHQARLAKDRAVLESLKPPPPTEATREVAISALAAMRRMLR